jgi:uncharacterized membrane protein (DUF2068 family)
MVRPTGVTIIAILDFVGATFCVLGGIGMMAGGGILATMMNQQGQANGMSGLIASLGAVMGVFFLIIAAVEIILGVGLLKLKEWARMVTVILTAILAALGLLGLLGSFAHFNLGAFLFKVCVLAIQIFIIVYLMKPEVKAAFQGNRAMAPA